MTIQCFRTNLLHSLYIAGIVGPLLIVVNEGLLAIPDPLPFPALYLKLLLNFAIPFSVATVSSVLANHHLTQLQAGLDASNRSTRPLCPRT